MLPLPHGKKESALRIFKMAMKQTTLASFHFKSFSNDQYKPLLSTLGENTNAYSPSIPDACGPQKTLQCFILMKLLFKLGF